MAATSIIFVDSISSSKKNHTLPIPSRAGQKISAAPPDRFRYFVSGPKETGADYFAQSLGRPSKGAPESGTQEIAAVSAQKLISGIAGKGHGDGLARDFADNIGRNLRAVGEGLVIDGRQIRDDGQRLGW